MICIYEDHDPTCLWEVMDCIRADIFQATKSSNQPILVIAGHVFEQAELFTYSFCKRLIPNSTLST